MAFPSRSSCNLFSQSKPRWVKKYNKNNYLLYPPLSRGTIALYNFVLVCLIPNNVFYLISLLGIKYID
jgi:hypothetical protein